MNYSNLGKSDCLRIKLKMAFVSKLKINQKQGKSGKPSYFICTSLSTGFKLYDLYHRLKFSSNFMSPKFISLKNTCLSESNTEMFIYYPESQITTLKNSLSVFYKAFPLQNPFPAYFKSSHKDTILHLLFF